MITPDGHFFDIGNGRAEFLSDLADGTVVVETSHRGEATWIKIFGVLLSNQGVGVGRVADNEHLDVALC